ncbi:MAG: AAA family ATPase [Beijerinckiaceae bacterium]
MSNDESMRAAAQEWHRERQGARRPLLSKAALSAIGAGQSGAPHILHRPPSGPSPYVTDSLPVAPPEPTKVELVSAASIEMTAIRWLWPGYLARGKMHIIGGAPGCGKTTIVLSLATTVTRGRLFPDASFCRTRGNVIIWSGEDDPADTLAPRLAAAGADMSKVFFVGPVREGDRSRSFDPAKDAAALRAAIKTAGGAALLMVDPIVSAVAGDSHKNAEVRRALQPLADLAAEVDAALIGITHFSKGTAGRDPTERLTGSLAFGALARVVMIAAKIEPKEDEPEKRIFARSKSNIGPDGGGFEYDLEQIEVPGHADMFASVVRWGSTIEGTARDILAEAEAAADDESGVKGAVESFLREFLADGPKSVREVKAAAEAHGYSWRTCERAKKAIGVRAVKESLTSGWAWSLGEDRQKTPNTANKKAWRSSEKLAVFGDDEFVDGGVEL